MRVFFLISLVSACGTSNTFGGGGGAGGGGDDDDAPRPTADGTYIVRSQIDITVDAVLPEPAHDLVATLRDFSVHPAQTLIDLADQAGVPAIAELRAILPDYVEGKLEGWLDDEIRKVQIDGVPVTMLASDSAAAAETAITQFELDSEIAIAGATSTHRLIALDFAPAGFDARFAITATPSDVISATATISTTQSTLAIGDHRFGLAYGEYVWRAIDGAVTQRFGAGLRATIGSAVDCPHVAAAVASKCVLGVCVGHQTELTDLCEAGLDEVVGIAHDKIASLRFDALHFAMGTAQLIDHDGDGIADELSNGTWTAELNAGLGLRSVPATFSATH